VRALSVQFLGNEEIMPQTEAPRSSATIAVPPGTVETRSGRESQAATSRNRLLVKSNGKILFLRADEVDWVEAQGDYVCLHVQGKKHLAREKISNLDQQLPSHTFLRIHRSTIVNMDRVRELQPLFYGEYAVILQDGTRLTLSRSFRERVFQRLIAVG